MLDTVSEDPCPLQINDQYHLALSGKEMHTCKLVGFYVI